MGKLRRGAPALLLIAAACSAGARPPDRPPAPAQPRQRTFAPLTIKEDAGAPTQAVILGTDEQDGSAILPIPGAPASELALALFVTPGGGPGGGGGGSGSAGSGRPTGGASAVTLATAPYTGGPIPAGLQDEPAAGAGAGAPWRAGVWTAALVAARTLGKDPTDFTFSALPSGYLDGAAASGVVAAGFLATIAGAKLDPAAAMTGALYPDGTLGPVPGLPEQLAAALARGKRKLGYPIGLRVARSAATGELVDLVQLARRGGAEATELADVHDAYRLLTGKALPRPVPVSEPEMAPGPGAEAALDGKYRDWQKLLAGEWAALLQLQQAGNLPPVMLGMARRAQSLGERAEQLHQQRAIAAAYGELIEAWVLAASATGTYGVLEKVQRGDLPAAVAALDQLGQPGQPAPGTRELFRKLGAIRPSTIGDHLLLRSALEAALRGWAFETFAADELARARGYLEGLAGKRKEELSAPTLASELVSAVAPAIALLERARAEALRAQQRLEYEREQTLAYACSLPDVQRLSAAFQAAAAAGVSSLDALVTEPLARSHGVPLDTARLRLALHEPDYLVAYMLSHLASRGGLPEQLKQEWGEASLPWSLTSLAASELASFASAARLAAHRSLEVRADPLAGQPATTPHEQVLAGALERAARTARASARAARIATGAIPVAARVVYQQAAAGRGGDAGARLEALAAYWRSSAYSQLAVMLARH